jgi:ecotin
MALAAGAAAAVVGAAVAFGAADLRAFPPADAGLVRFVIELPQRPDEADVRVELIVGRIVKTDAVNHYSYAGALEVEHIPGWGFDRYILRKLGPMAGTLMAVDPGAPRVERFVSLGSESPLLPYNSRLPIVVYVPQGVQVRYRLWHGDAQARAAGDTAPASLPAAAESGRFVQKLPLPTEQAAVIAEGEFEARSIGSYSVRLYSARGAQPGDETTFFSAGLVRPRDGTVERVLLADLGRGSEPSLVVVIRSAGSGGYLSADAFAIGQDKLALCATVSGLSAHADPVAALRSAVPPGECGQPK